MLVKCHFSYIFNKMIIFLYIIIFFLTIIFNYSILNENTNGLMEEISQYYFMNTFPFVAFMGNFLAIFLFSFPFLSRQSQYKVLLITSGIKKEIVFSTKIFTVIICCFLYIIVQIVSFYLPIYIFKVSYVNLDVLYSFLDLFIAMMFFGNITLLFVIIYDNFYLSLIPLTILILTNNINMSEDSKLTKIFTNFLITFNHEQRLTVSYGKALFILALLLVLVIFIDSLKE